MINAVLASLCMAFGSFLYQFFFTESPDFNQALEYSFIQTVAIFSYQLIWVNE